MLRRTLLSLALVIAIPGVAAAQDEAPALPRVVLETTLGPVVIEVETVGAPVTAANFLRYVEEGRFDGTSFYRAMTVDATHGIVQGGTNNDPARVLPPIAHEPTTETGLSHLDGVVSMARHAPGTATGDLFIMVGDLPAYDAGRSYSVDPEGYAAFGRVIEGMEVVRRILAAPTSPTLGEGFMRGQMLDPVVVIVGAKRLAD